jgi:hypothetical protein
MAETTRHGTYSITNDREAWLKQQKRDTGLPESHFVNKGLDLVMGTEEINAIRLMITPALSFFLGFILFIFGVFFSDVLPVPVFVIMFLCSFVIISISWVALYKSLKVWRKCKVKQ